MEAPILVGDLELTAPIMSIDLPQRPDGQPYNGVLLLVRLRQVPVGYALLRPDALDPEGIACQVWEQLADAINARTARAGLPEVDALPAAGLAVTGPAEGETADRPMISVVVCTRNRPQSAPGDAAQPDRDVLPAV